MCYTQYGKSSRGTVLPDPKGDTVRFGFERDILATDHRTKRETFIKSLPELQPFLSLALETIIGGRVPRVRGRPEREVKRTVRKGNLLSVRWVRGGVYRPNHNYFDNSLGRGNESDLPTNRLIQQLLIFGT